MNKIKYFFALLLIGLSLQGCQDFLDVKPKGVLSEENLTAPENAEGLVISAYSALGSDHYTAPYSMWPYGNVRSDDAYKGGRDEADIQSYHFFETFVYTQPNMAGLEGGGDPDEMWFSLYISISRVNNALRALNDLTDEEMPLRKVRQAEMRFLRGHFYFKLKILWKYIPYIDEFVPVNDYENISNRQFTNDELWDKIAADFEFATENLPLFQPEVGRANQVAAKAYLGKVRLYQAYEQDENHNVVNINMQRMSEAVALFNDALASRYTLETDFANNFLPGIFQNGPEALWSVQYSIGDVSPKGRLNWGDVLNAPMDGGFGCCGFHQPSQNLVNAFKTDANGLPMLDDFNNEDYNGSQTVDPRLDHTVAQIGKPWKYVCDLVMSESWIRNADVYGTNMSLKENVAPTCDCMVNIDPFYGNSKNRIIIRLADVLLMKAEALIELGRTDEALSLINQIRARAAASTALLRKANGSPISNYAVGQYASLGNKEEARAKLRFERRLEFAMEGTRFFDLVRWGIADQVLNPYFTQEMDKRNYLSYAHFTKSRDEYLPIPQQQINWSQGLYVQNPGY
ncbi:MAG: RagB/SusD family nutrient uptake outer membrane protein [Clostridia bacterium]|nr:RagB/SusD family nutrient uptake outer membrane protein [Clostridia bacterium]